MIYRSPRSFLSGYLSFSRLVVGVKGHPSSKVVLPTKKTPYVNTYDSVDIVRSSPKTTIRGIGHPDEGSSCTQCLTTHNWHNCRLIDKFFLEKTDKVDSIRQTIIMSTKTAVRKTGSGNFEYHGDSKFSPGVYTIHPPSICNHMLGDEAIHLRSNAYEEKVIYIVYFHHMRNVDFHTIYYSFA